MDLLRAVAIFCEDIREERSGQDTLVGIISDNIALPMIPALMPRLGVYIRAHFDIATSPERVSASVRFPWDQRIELGAAEIPIVEMAFKEAKAQQNPAAGVVMKGLFSLLPIQTNGVITVMLEVGDREYQAGTLNIILAAQPNPAATASPPPP
jgi:hypothetical protein